MRSNTTSVPKSQSSPHSYSPSVPLSVYRELAAELQAARAMLDSLKTQNQQLAKQNQQLRQEIEKVVQSALQAQQAVDCIGVNRADAYHPHQELKSKPSRPISSSRSVHHRSQPAGVVRSTYQEGVVGNSSVKDVLIAVEEVEVDSYPHRSQSESSSEVSGWRLAIAIILVIATAFSAGYLLIRPLISNR